MLDSRDRTNMLDQLVCALGVFEQSALCVPNIVAKGDMATEVVRQLLVLRKEWQVRAGATRAVL